MPKTKLPKKPSAVETIAATRQAHETNRYKNHAYMNADGSVNGERLLAIVNRSPGVFELIMVDAMLEDGNIDGKYHFLTEEIVSALAYVIMLAGHGDEQSELQLTAIRKLVRPRKYEVPNSKIREIADRYETSPPLARGWELRRLMSVLSRVVEPLNKDRPYTPDKPILLQENPHAAHLLGSGTETFQAKQHITESRYSYLP